MDKMFAKEMAEYIQLSYEILADREATIQKQASALSSQKQASAQLNSSAVVETIDNCIGAGFIKEAERQQAIDAVTADPATLLGFLDKLAAKTVETRKAVAPLGKGVQKTATKPAGESVRESDALFESAFRAPVGR